MRAACGCSRSLSIPDSDQSPRRRHPLIQKKGKKILFSTQCGCARARLVPAQRISGESPSSGLRIVPCATEPESGEASARLVLSAVNRSTMQRSSVESIHTGTCQSTPARVSSRSVACASVHASHGSEITADISRLPSPHSSRNGVVQSAPRFDFCRRAQHAFYLHPPGKEHRVQGGCSRSSPSRRGDLWPHEPNSRARAENRRAPRRGCRSCNGAGRGRADRMSGVALSR